VRSQKSRFQNGWPTFAAALDLNHRALRAVAPALALGEVADAAGADRCDLAFFAVPPEVRTEVGHAGLSAPVRAESRTLVSSRYSEGDQRELAWDWWLRYVPQLRDLAGPEVGSTAGFDSHQTGQDLGYEPRQLTAAKLANQPSWSRPPTRIRLG
jgi:hypothetical protein